MIRGIALHFDGRIAVTESNPKRISMFDGRGRTLGVVGRIGGGPAEYRDPYSSAWLADTLAIYDPGESRILYLTQGKTHLRTETTARFTGPNVRFYPVSRTKAYLQIPVINGNRSVPAYVGLGGTRTRDTVRIPELPPVASGTACRVANGMRFFTWYSAPRNFGYPVSADGAIALGNTGQYDIRIQRRTSTVATITRIDFVVAPLSDAAWRFGNVEYQKHLKQYGASSCDSPPVRPRHLAPILAMAPADNGDIWVTVRGKDEFAFNVFAADGRMLATAAATKGARTEIPIAVAGDRLAFVTADQDGVQVVNLVRIVR